MELKPLKIWKLLASKPETNGLRKLLGESQLQTVLKHHGEEITISVTNLLDTMPCTTGHSLFPKMRLALRILTATVFSD